MCAGVQKMMSFAMDSNHINGFFDQGDFEAMKTLSGYTAPCCEKHQFCAKMTVST